MLQVIFQISCKIVLQIYKIDVQSQYEKTIYTPFIKGPSVNTDLLCPLITEMKCPSIARIVLPCPAARGLLIPLIVTEEIKSQ